MDKYSKIITSSKFRIVKRTRNRLSLINESLRPKYIISRKLTCKKTTEKLINGVKTVVIKMTGKIFAIKCRD